MSKFVDENGDLVRVINAENIDKFKDFLLKREFLLNEESREISPQSFKFDGVGVANLFKDKNGDEIGYSKDSQIYLGKVIGRIYDDDQQFLDQTADTLLDNAEKYPDLLEMCFSCAGNFGNGNLYQTIVDKVKKRTVSQNMPALFALDHHSYLSAGIVEGVPSKKDIEFFEKIYAKELGKGYYEQSMLRKLIAVGYFANAKLSPDLRREVNKQYFEQLHIKTLQDRVLQIDTKYFDLETATDVVFGYGMGYHNTVIYGTEGPHGRTSDFDKKMQEILLTLSYKVEPHDRNNGGKEKTLNRRFSEVCVAMWNIYSKKNVKSFDEIPAENREGIIRDMYLKTAMYDVRDGRAADLEPAALQAVLNEDKRGHYFRMIPQTLITEKKLKLNARQQELAMIQRKDLRNHEISNFIPNSPHLSLKEKEDTLAGIAASQQEKAEIKKEYEKVVKEAEKDNKEIKDINARLTGTANALKTIQMLQEQYANIATYLSENKYKREEIGLEKTSVNHALYAAVSGNPKGVAFPKYDGLPFFGRDKEVQRREKLRQEVDRMNQIIQTRVVGTVYRDHTGWLDTMKKYADGSFIKGEGMLSFETAKRAEDDIDVLRLQLDSASRAYKQKYGVAPNEPLKEAETLDDILKREQAISEAQERVAGKKQKLQEKAKAGVLPPETSELKAAGKDAPDAQKREIRARNTKVVDPLQARMEKSQQNRRSSGK